MSYFGMSKLAMKWALKKPATVHYPFEPRKMIAQSRGTLVFTKDNCIYCNICAKKCPADAIIVNRAQKKWTLDRLRCVTCGYCVEVCPKDCLKMAEGHGNPLVTRDREVH